ncbi:type VI secretion system contractile sheath protein TssC [Pseudotamlana carrageenivorans]|uniref:Type VI secretion system contractile sheath protein TssC n=1 Tax=Pseudotamlana carrageenivorans TaxID=2069432 RepID=A0A2I7SKF8_9FLAO|nr:type VI secretion system contractile sheath protein TssC [Tamlana carrageenivorans]AUS06370.1 type VI secretion system contractile sheath protein TssC [Tamlana carrageenivorans]
MRSKQSQNLENKLNNAVEIQAWEAFGRDVLQKLIPPLHFISAEDGIDDLKLSKEEKEALCYTLGLWETLLEDGEGFLDMRSILIKNLEQLKSDYERFLKASIEKAKPLEVAYHSVGLFFNNANEASISRLTVMNADIEQLKDLDNPVFIDAVRDEINSAFDRLDLSSHYSLLVIPGYLGANKVLDRWAKLAFEHKVFMVTDFAHLDAPDDVVAHFKTTNHVRNETYLSNVVMTCNWFVGRGKYDFIAEEDDLYVPPSLAVAGKLYSNSLSQASAGRKYGALKGVGGVCFKLKKHDLAILEGLGLIPMYFENGQIIAYSAKTLFNGNNLGLQTYSVVRVFDYVSKVLIDYFNRKTFENFNVRTRKEFIHDIVSFLDKNTGAQKLIESFSIKRLEQDMEHKDRVHLELYMEPYFPAKNFLIHLNGKIGDSGKANSWEAHYEQKG